MRNHRLYGALAREQMEQAAEAPPAPAPAPAEGEAPAAEPVVVEAGADSLEADMVEINDEIVDVQTDEATTDEATAVVSEMEVAVESLRIIAQNGGLCKGGAAILNQFQESWNRRLGLDDTHGTLSAESFGGVNSRAGQTQLAAESIAEKAKSVWADIVELFKKAIAAIAGVWKKIFDASARLKGRAEALSKAAQATKGEAKSKTFEAQNLAEKLHINGTVDAKAAAAALVAETDVLANLTKHATEFANSTAGAIASATAHAGGGEVLQSLLTEARKIAQGDFAKVADPASVGISAPENCELYKGKALPGNKAVIAIVPVSEQAISEADGKAFKAAGYKMGLFDASKKVADKAQLPTLSAADVDAMAKQMVTVADKLSHYQSLQKAAEEAGKKMIAAVEKASKEKAVDEIGANAEDATKGDKIAGKVVGWAMGIAGQAVAKCAMGMVSNGAPPVAAYIMNAAGFVLQYGEQSLKQYGAAPAAEKKPAEGAAPAAA